MEKVQVPLRGTWNVPAEATFEPVSACVPALVPLVIAEAWEVLHGQADLPASGRIPPGRRPPGGRSVALHLRRCADMEGDHGCPLGRGGQTTANAERDDNGGGDGSATAPAAAKRLGSASTVAGE